jgi:phage virion morphogenesis protein
VISNLCALASLREKKERFLAKAPRRKGTKEKAYMSGVAVRVLAADVLARLQGMEERGGNLSGLFRNFGEYMKGSIEKNFAAGGRPAKWRPLAGSTLKSFLASRKSFRTKAGSVSKKGAAALSGRLPLTDKGILRRSIAPTEIRANGIVIGTNKIYAAIHQFGGQAGRGKKVPIPARPYLLFQDEDITYLEMTLVNYILTGRMG